MVLGGEGILTGLLSSRVPQLLPTLIPKQADLKMCSRLAYSAFPLTPSPLPSGPHPFQQGAPLQRLWTSLSLLPDALDPVCLPDSWSSFSS